MSPRHKKQSNWGSVLAPILLVLAGVVVLAVLLLKGNNIALFHTKGQIAEQQLDLMILTVGIMLVIAIPAVFLVYFIAWKYRETNHKAKRDDSVGHGKFLNVTMWLAPAIFAVVLAAIMWPATHKLEPKKVIAADAEPMTIQVVAMRWKWLFIYPEQKIATVNYVQVPTGTPVTFQLTADETPMSSFWIPNLGGMLYAMTGHINNLNLIAETAGEYPGSSAEINGAGFAGMKFIANASTKADFEAWVDQVSLTADELNVAAYSRLLKPSENHPATYYTLADEDLYAKVVMKYMRAHEGHGTSPEQHEGHH